MMFDKKSECDYLCTRVTISAGMFITFVAVPVFLLFLIYWLGGGNFERDSTLGFFAFIGVLLAFASGVASIAIISWFNKWLTTWLEEQTEEKS